MQIPNEKIKLYVVRDFGQRLTVVMDFLRQNWKPVLLYLTYFLLPLSLVQALSLNSFMGGYMDLIGGLAQNAEEPSTANIVSFALNLLAFFGLYMVGAVLMYAVIYGLMRLYERGDGNLSAVTWTELKPDFMLSMKRSVILMLVGIVFAVVLLVALGVFIALAALVTPALIFLVYILFLAITVCLAPPLSLITPVYVFEEQQTLMGAIKKGLRLGFGTWLGTVGVIVALGFIINIVSQFVAMPWTIMFFIKALFGMGIDGLDGTWTENVFYTFAYYLTGVLECFGGYVTSAALVIGAAYLYGHAAEKLDGITVEKNIQNFENL
jgi:hypothetical protein